MSNWELTDKWKMLGGVISSGSAGHTGVQVHVMGAPADLTDDERYEIGKVAEATNDLVCRAVARRDPARKERAAKERAEILGLFPGIIFVEDLPNGYCKKWCCEHLPWFRVTTRIGHIEIGWRKRVINIDWSKTNVKKTGDELFPNAGTKGDSYVHAWSVADAEVCILKILEAGVTPQ
jgi:hypothetical protein